MGLEESNAALQKGCTLVDIGQFEQALELFDEAIEMYPANLGAYGNRGRTLSKLGRHEEALAAFDLILKLDTNNTMALWDKGKALDELGRYNEALTSFDRVITLEPTNAGAFIGKGFAHAHLEQDEAALAAFEHALEHDPSSNIAQELRKITLHNLAKTATIYRVGHVEEAQIERIHKAAQSLGDRQYAEYTTEFEAAERIGALRRFTHGSANLIMLRHHTENRELSLELLKSGADLKKEGFLAAASAAFQAAIELDPENQKAKAAHSEITVVFQSEGQ